MHKRRMHFTTCVPACHNTTYNTGERHNAIMHIDGVRNRTPGVMDKCNHIALSYGRYRAICFSQEWDPEIYKLQAKKQERKDGSIPRVEVSRFFSLVGGKAPVHIAPHRLQSRGCRLYCRFDFVQHLCMEVVCFVCAARLYCMWYCSFLTSFGVK